MNKVILKSIDEIEEDSILVEYDVIQSLCDSYIKEIYNGQYILEDGEEKTSDDNSPKSAPPSFLEKAINFVRRLIIRLKSILNTKKLSGYQRLFTRNFETFAEKFQIKALGIEDLKTDENGNIADDQMKMIGLVVIKKQWMSKFTNLLKEFISYCDEKTNKAAYTYVHNVNYEKMIGKLGSIESKLNKYFDQIRNVDKAYSKNINKLDSITDQFKDMLIKIDYPDDVNPENNEHLDAMLRWAPLMVEKTKMLYFYIRDVEKNIKTAKEIEKLYGEEKDKDNLAYYTKYITKYMIIMDKFSMCTIKALALSAKEFKTFCRKLGIDDIGNFKETFDPDTLEISTNDYTTDEVNLTGYKDLKKAGISKKERRVMT